MLCICIDKPSVIAGRTRAFFLCLNERLQRIHFFVPVATITSFMLCTNFQRTRRKWLDMISYTLFPLYSHVYSRLSPVLPSSRFVIILLLNSSQWFSVSCKYSLSSSRKRIVGRFSTCKNSILFLLHCYNRIVALVPINEITPVINSPKLVVYVYVLHFT